MIKKFSLMSLLCLLFAGNIIVANENKKCTCSDSELTRTEAMILGGLIVGGVVVVIPYALGAATVAKIAIVCKSAAAYLVPTTSVGKVGLGLTAAQLARPHLIQTTEEKVVELLNEKASRPAKAKSALIDCLKDNKHNSPRNAAGIPICCEEAALLYALNSSASELNKRIEAFKKGTCFCH